MPRSVVTFRLVKSDVAEIAARRVTDPLPILPEDRLIKPQLLPHEGDPFGRGLPLRHDVVRRIAWQQMNEDRHNTRHNEDEQRRLGSSRRAT